MPAPLGRPLITATLMFAMLLSDATRPAWGHDKEVHRDATAYAYEIMAVSRAQPLRSNFEGDAIMLAFLDEMHEAVDSLDLLPNDLPAPPRDVCIDPEVQKRFVTQIPLAGVTPTMPANVFPTPVDLSLLVDESSCGTDPYWRPGTLYRNAFPQRATHAGNVFGYWAAHPDDRHGETELQWRPSNIAPLNQFKSLVEQAAGAIVGPVWITGKCFTDCMKGLFLGDFDECEGCIDDSYQQATQGIRDGIATVDGLFPGIPLGGNEALAGMCHHIDMKKPIAAPGWPLRQKPRYDDRSGLYGLTAGPFHQPGAIEEFAMFLSDVGASIDYDNSEGVRSYQVTDGKDHHKNTKRRDKEDFEYMPWPYIPMPPVDNLAWYGWREYRKSVRAPPIRTRYLGWVLHGIGDATVPMHATGTFAWGHRPYEDAEKSFGRQLLGEHGDEVQFAAAQAAQIVRRAKVYRQMMLEWRSYHPELGADVPVRDIITNLADTTYLVGQNNPAVYNDVLSTEWAASGPTRTHAIEYYKQFRPIMQDRLVETVAATIAFLMSVPEVRP
jgi:hypothetical protein